MAMAGNFQMCRIERCPFRGPALINALKCRNLQASIGTQGQQECNLANLNLNSKVETILLMDLESRIWYLSAVMPALKCFEMQECARGGGPGFNWYTRSTRVQTCKFRFK